MVQSYGKENHLQTQKRTYALPADTIHEFEKVVTSGQRSTTLALLIEDWLQKRREEALRQNIIEDYREMWIFMSKPSRNFIRLRKK